MARVSHSQITVLMLGAPCKAKAQRTLHEVEEPAQARRRRRPAAAALLRLEHGRQGLARHAQPRAGR
jgi:hypothetical protein